MTDRTFAEHAQEYWEKNLPAIPFKKGEKRPSITGWSQYSDNLPGDEACTAWINKKGDHGIGLVMGMEVVLGKRLIGLDIDEPHLEHAVLAMIPGNPPIKRGKKGCTAFVLMESSLPVQSTTFKGKNGLGDVDILANKKCTVLPPSIHPGTGKPYTWDGDSLVSSDLQKISALSDLDFRIINCFVSSKHSATIIEGKTTHLAVLGLSRELVTAGASDDQIHQIIKNLLPRDYSGNSLNEVQEMIDGARRKGFDQTGEQRPYDPGDIGPIPLGSLADGRYVFSDQIRHITISESSNRLTNLATLMNLAPMSFWLDAFPKYQDGEVVGVNSYLAADTLMQLCREAGGFDVSRVRGRGVYLDAAGNVVVNFGNQIPKDSKYIYVCHIPIDIGTDTDGEFDVEKLLEFFQLFNWSNKSFAYMLLGWAVTAVICGVLEWRPHVFLAGAKNTGKTTLVFALKAILDSVAVVLDGQSTEAGIRQKVGPDSRPIILDEFESDQNIHRMKTVIKLARSASSASGQIARGTPEGKALEFNASSSFLFAAINPMMVTSADQSRIVVMTLEKHDDDKSTATAISAAMEALEGSAPQWCALAISQISNIRTSIKTLRLAFPPCDSRHALNISTLLAAAWCARHQSEITEMEAEDLLLEHKTLIDELAHAHESDDSIDCLNALLEYRVDRDEMLGTILARLKPDISDKDMRKSAAAKMEAYGIKTHGDGFLISNTHRGVKEVYSGTLWEAGGWVSALPRLPGAKKESQKRFSGNNRALATWVPFNLVPNDYETSESRPNF
jgi:bifunctional DNA primase/polymerase-like protein